MAEPTIFISACDNISKYELNLRAYITLSYNMLGEWFECKVRYEKTLESGLVKKVTEPYLLDAYSFTEAEKRFIGEMEPFMKGKEFQVSDIKRARYAELIETSDEAADRWFKVKISFLVTDEKSGKEKHTAENLLVQASDLRDAVRRLDESMKGSIVDYEINSVSETAIMDVFHYNDARETQI